MTPDAERLENNFKCHPKTECSGSKIRLKDQ